MIQKMSSSLLASLLMASLVIPASSLAQMTAYVDFLSADAAFGNVPTLQDQAGGDFTGAVASVETVALVDFVSGTTTGWTLTVNSTGMEYRTASATKDAGVPVTGGAAYDNFADAFGVVSQERWDGVIRGDENYLGDPSVEFVFTGLSADTTYDFALLHNYRTGTSVDKFATATFANADGNLNGSFVSAPTRYNDDGLTLAFSDINTGADGSFSVTVGAIVSGGDFYLQGLSLTASAVPEPAEMAAIVGLLGFGFVVWRRRGREVRA